MFLADLKPKPELQTEKGFAMLEVLVSILIVTTFVAVSLQAMVIAAYARVRAHEKSEAVLLIQEDLEQIKYQAIEANLAYNASNCLVGYSNALQGTLDSYPKLKSSKTFPNKQYSLNLNTTPNNPTSHILKLEYEVKDARNTTIAELYTEVIPDASLGCQ